MVRWLLRLYAWWHGYRMHALVDDGSVGGFGAVFVSLGKRPFSMTWAPTQWIGQPRIGPLVRQFNYMRRKTG